uniref:NADH-ubiquinone oxidoreductase chain 5 n=1 Tax=Choroterpides apiculata (nomen nudum) TaxID=2729127 RepID=A0A6M3RFM9_9DIPT|nr:NADH dehydrogenase subunit 5 [Choroterpides apiculata (nomen nudum)]
MFSQISICFMSFVFLMFMSLSMMITGVYFLIFDFSMFFEWEVLSINSMSIVMTLLLDYMSLIFMGFVLLISSLVIYYSREYMAGDFNINRFIILVLMFVLSMMFLIISPNLVSILLGWDGLGLVSYCLVIYYQNVKSYNAGMLTALSNRIGDVALLLAIAWMINFGSFNYIYYMQVNVNSLEVELISVLVVLAAMTKSAQIPFSAWLPAAMAAPTPVSALVHSSTLVTAGVYLLIRFSPMLEGKMIMKILLLISGLTMFMAGMGANFEFDLKKIIALSTLSQLGLMMSILSMGFYELAYFHLLTHALFKALLFMCAGAVIHNMKDSQDIRSMGSLMNQMPITCSCLNVANLALCGFPFLAGFYSKDLILEMASMSFMNLYSYMLFMFSTGLTMCYSFRLVYYCLTGDCMISSCHPMNDEGSLMLKSMLGLLFMTVIGGSMMSWLLMPSPSLICLPYLMKLMALLVSFVGGWMGYEIAKFSIGMKLNSMKSYNLVVYLGSMWFMPSLSTVGIIKTPLLSGLSIVKSMDHGWSELMGGQGIFSMFSKISTFNQYWQSNSLKIYIMMFLIWMIMLFMLILVQNF